MLRQPRGSKLLLAVYALNHAWLGWVDAARTQPHMLPFTYLPCLCQCMLATRGEVCCVP